MEEVVCCVGLDAGDIYVETVVGTWKFTENRPTDRYVSGNFVILIIPRAHARGKVLIGLSVCCHCCRHRKGPIWPFRHFSEL